MADQEKKPATVPYVDRVAIGVSLRKLAVWAVNLADALYPENKTIGILKGEHDMGRVADSWNKAKAAFEARIRELQDQVSELENQLSNPDTKLDEADEQALSEMESVGGDIVVEPSQPPTPIAEPGEDITFDPGPPLDQLPDDISMEPEQDVSIDQPPSGLPSVEDVRVGRQVKRRPN